MQSRTLLVLLIATLTLFSSQSLNASTINFHFRIDHIAMGITLDDDGDDVDDDSIIRHLGIVDDAITNIVKVDDDFHDEYRYTFELKSYAGWSVGDSFGTSISYDASAPIQTAYYPIYSLTDFASDLTRYDFGIGNAGSYIYRYYWEEQNGTEHIKTAARGNGNHEFSLYRSNHSDDWSGSFYFIDPSEKWALITISSTPVPEPSTLVSLGISMIGLVWFGRKRKQ